MHLLAGISSKIAYLVLSDSNLNRTSNIKEIRDNLVKSRSSVTFFRLHQHGRIRWFEGEYFI